MFLGGSALEGPRYIRWSFVSSRRERIEEAKEEWRTGRFKLVPGEAEFIPLPEKQVSPVLGLRRRGTSVGSANVDIRSFSINYEISAVLYSKRLAKGLEEAFQRDFVTAPNSIRRSQAQPGRPIQGFGGEAPVSVVVRSCGGPERPA